MSDTSQRAVAESVFERNQRREAQINDALKQEEASDNNWPSLFPLIPGFTSACAMSCRQPAPNWI